jgi:hypothetical protein
MTISLFRNFCCVLILVSSASGAMAAEDHKPVQVLAGGRSFDSFEAYAQFKDPSLIPAPFIQDTAVPLVAHEVLGLSPSLAEIVKEFQDTGFEGRPVCRRDSLVEMLQAAAEGKDGPLLLVADENKVRIMELKPQLQAPN